MFLIEDRRFGTTFLVFTWLDPRAEGYVGNVDDDVSLDYDIETSHGWPDKQAAPESCLGRAPADPKHYRVFRHDSDLRTAGYQPVLGTFVVLGSWREYLRLQLKPPNPEQPSDEQWYDYLDKLDEAARQRRRRAQKPDHPMSGDRDSVASWLAREHLIADSGIREIWYLPQGAPPDEIRLLELSDRLAENGSQVEAIDFGVEIEGANFRLVVADVSSDQLEKVKKDPSRLPTGWSLEGNKIWGRRGA